MIAAQASAAIWAGVDEWVRRNPQKSVTDFVLEACMAKLDAEKIPFDRDAAIFDGRHRVPANRYPPHRPQYFVMNDASNSGAKSVRKRISRKVEVSGQKGSP